MSATDTSMIAHTQLLPPLPTPGRMPWWWLAISAARQAFVGLAAHKLRSALALLALVAGVAAVLLVLSVGQSARQATAGGFAAVGANLITVQGFVVPATAAPSAPGQPTMMVARAGTASLTLQDVQTLRQLPHVIAASPDEPAPVQAVAGDRTMQTAAFGTYPDVQLIQGFKVQAGSFFSDADVNSAAAVAVLGQGAAARLFPGTSAVGQQVRINNVTFTVVGVLQAIGSTPGIHEVMDGLEITPDTSLIVPVTTWQQRLQGAQPGGKGGSGPVTGGGPGPQAPPGANVIQLQGRTLAPGQQVVPGATFGMVQVEVDATPNVAAVKDEIKQALEKNHQIAPGGDDDFTIGGFLAAEGAARQSLAAIELAMAIVAAVALLLGGFGVANVLLAAVSERTKEIGLRLAVGAEPADIRRQFLVEAITLALLGGLVGSAAGLALAPNLGELLGVRGRLAPTPLAIGVALAAALLLGLIFGSYPAQRAARLDPIQALRRS